MPDLFDPYPLGRLTLPNRLVMAPLTRNRAGAGEVPGPLNAEYYAQRAGAGLLITEGTQPAATGQAYAHVPGIGDDAQQAGWALVADAVHAAGGRIFVQLMHGGRISHPDLQPDGRLPVAPSAVRPELDVITDDGPKPAVAPRALGADELPGVRAQYVDAARRAVAAGLDGVELHSANGYLLHQFLSENTNRRTDSYGGSAANRARFVVETAAEVAAAIGADRTGIRISPEGTASGIQETDSAGTYRALLAGLDPLGLVYLHAVTPPGLSDEVRTVLRDGWSGTLIVSTGFDEVTDVEAARRVVADGEGDLVAVGRQFIANPDLVRRWRTGAPLNTPDPSTFYGGDAHGYTDYPFLAGSDSTDSDSDRTVSGRSAA